MKRSLRLSVVMLGIAGTVHAQLISVKTIPIAQADQFQIFPSRNIGMGDISIALADTVFDVSANPAKGARLRETSFFSAPFLYTVTRAMGAGRTFPMGALGRVGSWFGGFSAALQEVDARQTFGFPTPVDAQGNNVPTGSGSHGNKFLFGTLGKTLGQTGLSLGGSFFWSELHAIDGVDQLYAGSVSVAQFGHAVDARLGALKQWDGGASLSAVMLHNRYAMTHDVTFADLIWSPATQGTIQRARVDHNIDDTNTWGVQLSYDRPLATPGLRVGAIATANRMSHPKIPEYEIVQVVVIPWDPGHTNAFNFGVGISQATGPATFGADLIFEPIWTHTWGEAQAPVINRSGATIPAGGRTVENWFHFTNAILRVGVAREFGPLNLQLGLDVHPVHYQFWQVDNVQVSGRTATQGWTERSPTWGIGFRFPELELRYQGRVTGGTGRPGASPGVGGILDAAVADGGSIVSPPSTDVSLGRVSLFTHQISLSIPLGRTPKRDAQRRTTGGGQ